MSDKKGKVVSFFFRYSEKYKISLSLVIIFLIIGSSLSLVLPFLNKNLIDTLTLFDQEAVKGTVMNDLIMILVTILIVQIAQELFKRASWYTLHFYQPKAFKDIETESLSKLENLDYNFFTNNFTGALIAKIKRGVKAYERIIDAIIRQVIPFIVILTSSVFILGNFSSTLFLISLFWIVTYIVLSYFVFRWKYKIDKNVAEEDSKVTAALSDSITNIFSTKIFAQKKYEESIFNKVTERKRMILHKNWNLENHIFFVQAILFIFIDFFVIYFSLQAWYRGDITIGTIVLIQTLMFMILMELSRSSQIIKIMFESFADAKELTEILDREEEIKDPEFPEQSKIKKGKIEFKDLTFNYENRDDIFDKFNLEIEEGESIGLVGESGSGKSSLTKLLLRFIDPKNGVILIDGQNIKNITQEDLRRNISFVPQESILFHRTLAENIAYSNPTASQKEIEDAAKKANLHSSIQELPEKYNTYVGERGVKLSGGERQRVTIARAILKKAPIIIFDEATSSLDSKSEKLIQDAMDNLTKGKTTIVIAHRLSTVQKMDRILVMEKGKIIEDGTHTKLMKKKGKYFELWNHQVDGFIE